jgi:signal transduction histidine kinase
MATNEEVKDFQDQLRRANEQLLLSAFNARDNADKANEALILLQAVLRQMPAGVIIADPTSGRITLSNGVAARLWPGCTCIADMTRYFETHCFHADGTRCTAKELPLLSGSMISDASSTRANIRFTRRDSSRGAMSIDAAAVRNTGGEVIAVVLTCEDITEQQAIAEREQTVLLQLRELSAKLESAREEERTRIAWELHDELGQSLTGLHLDLSRLSKRVPSDRVVTRQRIESMIEATKQIILDVRRLASDLRPSILDNLGLVPAIEWQLAEFQKRTRVRAKLDYRGERDIDRGKATVVFRIVQEALTNVIRHAQATRVHVRLSFDNHRLSLQVTDNGRGIRASEIACPDSLGIVGMHERVIRLGGEFKIAPKSPKGTQLDVVIPI